MMFLADIAFVLELIALVFGIGLLVKALRNKKDKAKLATAAGFLILILTIIAFTLHHLLSSFPEPM